MWIIFSVPRDCRSVMYRITVAAVLLICSISLFNLTNSEEIHRRLSDDEIEAAKALAEQIRPMRAREATGRKSKASPKDQPWYQRVKFSNNRFNAIGILFSVKLVREPITGIDPTTNTLSYGFAFENDFGECTAFYVAPDILATGAHCLKDHGVTPTSRHILIFRQMYDGSKPYSDKLAADYERVVQEWIYLEEYDTKELLKIGYCKESGYDYAFLRTNGPSFKDQHYTLATPDQFLRHMGKTSMKIVGYPEDYADFFEPVYIECKLAKWSDRIVKNDKGMQRASWLYYETMFLSLIRDNQLFCVSDKGNLQNGGSGGPWFIDEADLKSNKADKEKLRWVIGISSWSLLRDELARKGIKDAQSYCMTTITPWFTKQTLEIYEVIKKTPANESWKDALAKWRKRQTK